MSDNLTQTINLVFGSEGGYVNNPKDPGGPTKFGITAATLGAWRRLNRKATAQEVENLTLAEAAQILDKQYAQSVRYNDLPAGLDYAVFDFSTNSGPSQAVKTLQRVLGVTADGVMGVKTLDAIRQRPVVDTINKYQDARLTFMKGLKTWATFGKGWSARVAEVRQKAVAMARGNSTPLSLMSADPGSVPQANPDQTKLSASAQGKGAIATAMGVATGAIGGAKDAIQPLTGSSHFVDTMFTCLTAGGAVLAIIGIGVVVYKQMSHRGALA